MSHYILEMIRRDMLDAARSQDDGEYVLMHLDDIRFLLDLIACAEEMVIFVRMNERTSVKSAKRLTAIWRELLYHEA